MSEGKTLFFRADNLSTSADGEWTEISIMLHETFWFVDNSTTSHVTTYDFQGDFYLCFLCIVTAV